MVDDFLTKMFGPPRQFTLRDWACAFGYAACFLSSMVVGWTVGWMAVGP